MTERQGVEIDYCPKLLEQAQINPAGMVDFIAGLKTVMDTGVTLPIPLLSTHPAPQERMDRLQQKKAAFGRREFKSFTREFQTLQDGLKPPPELPEAPGASSGREGLNRKRFDFAGRHQPQV